MPNWCYTSVKFHGNEKEIKNLHELISKSHLKSYRENGFDGSYGCWLGNVLYEVGLGERTEANDSSLIRCRGWIDSFYAIESANNESTFVLDMASAWVPHINMWLRVIEALKLESVKFSYVSEEPLMELYAMYDPFDDWPYRYILDVNIEEEDWDNADLVALFEKKYCTSEKEFIETVQKFLGTDETDYQKLISQLENFVGKNKHTYIMVYKYEMLETPEWV